MSQLRVKIPQSIFHAQKLVQNARYYDHTNQYEQAIKYYMQATKIFLVLLKNYPNMPFQKQYIHETQLCLQRVNQLKPHLTPATKNPQSSPTSSSHTKNDLEHADLQERVLSCRVTPDPNLSWDDIIGLEEILQHIYETVLFPLQHPEILKSGMKHPRAILLFGPPGCGKTHLIRVLATQAKIPIFNISASSLLSKWHGESQKMIRVLYETAWKQAPSIIFIDEFDAIFGASNPGTNGSSEASRILVQIQTELQQFMDGMFTPSVNKTITIVATNSPWHLKIAQLRRFDRILYVPPPSPSAIFKMLTHFLRKIPHSITTRYLKWLAYELNGYTPDEILKICSTAYYHACSRSNKNKTSQKLTLEDIQDCISILKPVLRLKELKGVSTSLFRKWNEEFGLPPIEYPVQPWEKVGEWRKTPNPIPLIDYPNEEMD